jgi:IS6 family transposase
MRASLHRDSMNKKSFKHHRLPPQIILLAVRWYCRYPLSNRDVRDLLCERGIHSDRMSKITKN